MDSIGDYMGSYKGRVKAILGKPCRGTTSGVQPRNN